MKKGRPQQEKSCVLIQVFLKMIRKKEKLLFLNHFSETFPEIKLPIICSKSKTDENFTIQKLNQLFRRKPIYLFERNGGLS